MRAAAGATPSAEDALKLTKVFEEDVRPAVKGMPQPVAEKVLNTVDPKNALPAVASAGATGKWSQREVGRLLTRTPGGMHTLELVNKYKLTITTNAAGKTYYDHALKTVFISEVAASEDAMNALVHEVEHADWAHTGRSVTASKVSRGAYIEGMCREEAAAESATIRNKFSLQTLENRSVAMAPTEEIYRNAFIEHGQALQPSTMSEAEKIAASRQAADNELFNAFHDGRVKNNLDGRPYTKYYGSDWDTVNAVPAARTP